MKCEKEYIYQIYNNLCMTDVVRCSEVERSMFGNIPRHFLPVRRGENSTDFLRVLDSCRPHGSSTLHLIKRENVVRVSCMMFTQPMSAHRSQCITSKR